MDSLSDVANGHSQEAEPLSHATDDSGASAPGVESIYLGFVKISDFGLTGRTGMWVRFRLDSADRSMPHPFDGLRWSHKPGDGLRLRLGITREVDGAWDTPVFAGEASLGWWSTDPLNGMQAKLWLDDGLDGNRGTHPFHGMPISKEAETLVLACWALGDDELLTEPPRKPKGDKAPSAKKPVVKVPFSESDATRQAVLKCGDKDFQLWCADVGVTLASRDLKDPLPSFPDDPVGLSKMVVTTLCDIGSRKELKLPGPKGDRARKRWARILQLYGEWNQARRTL